MSYGRFDVVLVLFPFTERKGHKQRPALVLSDQAFARVHSHSIVAMITTAARTRWPSDLAITDFAFAGLRTPCVVRAKLFTISHDLVAGKVGTLPEADRAAAGAWLASLLPVGGQTQ